MRHLKTTLAVVGGATILVLAGNTVALAATGHSLLLGKSNSADANTSITRTTSGSVLKLQSKSATNAPLTVNGTGKVTNLNADKVDGYEGSQMLNTALVYTKAVSVASPVSSFTLTLTNVPAGKYLFNSSGFLYVTSVTTEKGCVLSVPSTGQVDYEWFTPGSGQFIMPNGTGYIVVPHTQNLTYQCYDNSSTPQDWTSLSSQPLQLIFTKIASVSSGATPTLARVAAPRTATR